MEIVVKGIGEIRPYERNPRVNDHAVESVRQSIATYGYINPIMVDAAGVIIAGHTRYEAIKQLGFQSAPCIVIADLTEEQANAYRLADNKTGEASTWDYGKLENEINALAEAKFDISLLGFSEFELESLGKDFSPEKYTVDELADFWEGLGGGEDAEADHLQAVNYTIVCESAEDQAWLKAALGEKGRRLRRFYGAAEVIANRAGAGL